LIDRPFRPRPRLFPQTAPPILEKIRLGSYLGCVTRRTIGEIADGLVPALQRRGLVRKRYGHPAVPRNLLEF
jgi:hypothetical protein